MLRLISLSPAMLWHHLSATRSLLTTASRTAKQRACLAGANLVALTAQLRHRPRCHHAQVSQPLKQLLAWSPLLSHALLLSRLLSRKCPPVTSVMLATSAAILR